MLKKARELDISHSPLSEKEVAEIIAYLCYLRFFNKQGNVFIGKKLLNAKGCLKCHSIGQDEDRDKVAPDFLTIDFYVSPLYITQAMWNHGPNIFQAERAKGIKHIQLRGDEIVDITSALQDLTRPSKVKDEYMSFGDINNGKTLFVEKGCLKCHKYDNEEQSIGPVVQKIRSVESVIDIATAMWNHGPAMWEKMKELNIERSTFEGSDMADLVSYLFYTQYMESNGNTKEGEKLFKNKSCASCHIADDTKPDAGNKVALTQFLTPIKMVQATWNHAPIMRKEMQNNKLKWPEFSEAEMMDLYAYLSKGN